MRKEQQKKGNNEREESDFPALTMFCFLMVLLLRSPHDFIITAAAVEAFTETSLRFFFPPSAFTAWSPGWDTTVALAVALA